MFERIIAGCSPVLIQTYSHNPELNKKIPANEEAIAYSRSYYKELDHQSAIRDSLLFEAGTKFGMKRSKSSE